MTNQLEKAIGFITHQISSEHLHILALHCPEATLVEESKYVQFSLADPPQLRVTKRRKTFVI